MSERPTFILIDGHAVAYRAHFALIKSGAFTTSTGEPTESLYGFTRVLLDVLESKPEYLAASFDMGLSGREILYPEYKGTRDKMPPELAVQLPQIEALVRAFNIPILAVEDYEADDVIGTAARLAEEQGCQVRIITGDRDLLQLISPHTKVQLPDRSGGGGSKPDILWDLTAFKQEYGGAEPIQLVEMKALMGDSSDNIPGVAGVGDKGARNLVIQFGNLEGLYAHLELVKPAQRAKLEIGREMAFLSRTLATIKRDVPITLTLSACLARDFSAEQVIAVFDEAEFGDTLRKRLGVLVASHDAEEAERIFQSNVAFAPPHTVVKDRATLAELVRVLEGAGQIAFDTETTGLDPMSADLVGISLAVDTNPDYGYYIPLGHGDVPLQPSLFGSTESPDQLPISEVIEAIRPALTHPAIGKIAHNANYDLVILARYGIDVVPIADDTMISAWVLDPGRDFGTSELGLKLLARIRLGIKMKEIKELIGSGKNQITMAQVSVEDAAPYAAADAVATMGLAPLIRKDLTAIPQALEVYETLELPLIPVLVRMEMAGVCVDEPYLAELSAEMNAAQRLLEEEIYTIAGLRFNINSVQQLNDVLFNKLNLDTGGLKKTKTGGFSLTASVLDELAERSDHPILAPILRYRSLQKLLSTYIDALPQLINPKTGRVHTSYNQTGAVTGRLSSTNPNLQNIPIRTEEGRRVRQAFIARADHVLLSVDYSQIELRILAHYSGDTTLTQAFIDGQDIHRITAARLYNIAPEQVSKDQRRTAKTINFGLMYGMGAFRLARDTALTLSEAEAFIRAYFDNFPGVRDFLEETKRHAAENGYVRTLFGRRRYFPELTQDKINHQAKQRAEREAINSPIQGTNADIVKKAMIHIDAQLREQFPRSSMVLQVHDELVFDVPEDEIEGVEALVVEAMKAAGDILNVPVSVDSRYGANWHEMG